MLWYSNPVSTISYCSFGVEFVTKQEVVVTVNGNTEAEATLIPEVADMPVIHIRDLSSRPLVTYLPGR